MAIDKIIPRFLVSDEDERLLKEGAMTDALNVTISEDGDGTEGVLKNVRGTEAATAISGSELTDGDAVTVIGQVSDPQRGFIYFFVADDSGDSEHAIYQYNTKSVENDGLAVNKYRKVFKNSWLDFQPGGFVKADVLNGAFQQDGVIQTILYFTDNYNAPRKINVDRAIAGDYDGLSASKLDYALNSIKAAPVNPPSFVFTTDESITENNFSRGSFQFSTQFIYRDGEESAMSPYSKLAFSASVSTYGIEDSSIRTLVGNIENICEIDVNWSNVSVSDKYIPDVSKIRLLGRAGNGGAFFVIDEFDPSEDLNRTVHGVSTKIYDYQTGVYRFYNDGVYAFVGTQIVNKLYDNVPKLAGSQSLAGNRLFYSDYVDGFENNSVPASISVNYSPKAENVFAEPSNGSAAVYPTNPTEGHINIDLLNTSATWPGSNTYNSLLPIGTFIRVAFQYSPYGKFYNQAGNSCLTLNCTTSSGIFQVEFGYEVGTGSFPIRLDSDISEIDLSVETTSVVNVEGASDLIKDELASLNPQRSYEYQAVNTSPNNGQAIVSGKIVNSTDPSFTNGNTLTLATGTTVNYTYSFGDILDSSATDALFSIKPYVSSASFDFSTASVSGEIFDGITGVTVDSQSFIESDENSDLTYVIDITSSGDWNGSTMVVSNTYTINTSFFANAARPVPTFKHGCDHEFGIVYYDKYNRSGFVNRIGSANVAFIGDKDVRNSGNTGREGAASISVSIPADSPPPPWAVKWQVVYGGMSTYDSIFSYTTGGGYPARDVSDSSNPHPIKTGSKQVYLSLKTLDIANTEKSSVRDYSYTEGDKLRVVSYKDTSGNRIYPMDNNSANPQPIEFDVVGVKIFISDHDTNIIHAGGSSGHEVEDKYIGTFLILDCPSVNSGKQVDADGDGNVNDDLKYAGFDWFSITGEDYPNDLNPGLTNYWGNECVVEILSPKKNTSEKVYYEIGEAQQANGYLGTPPVNQHGPTITLKEGDVRFRLMPCKTPEYTGGTWNTGTPSDWVYKTIFIEDQSVSDAFTSKDWSKGRAHVVFENAAEVRRFNGVTYSDAYAEDVANLSLSSFNPSLGNFDSLDGRYGAVEYIGNYNDDLVALQENKLCLIPVNKNILEYASGSADVAVSTNVLGQRRYSAGDYGSGGHPEAVLIQDSSVYFVDESRQAVCSLTGGQLVPISEKGMSSFFESFFTVGHTKYVSGYDPRDNTYYLTGLGGSTTKYKTVGYDAARGVWQSRYSFTPDLYANQNNMLYSAKYVDAATDLIFHKHSDSTDHNTFYGTKAKSEVQVVSKMSPSRVKVFNAISYEGDSDAWEMSTGATTNLNQTSGIIHDAAGEDTPKFVEKEGAYYAAMPKDTAVKYVYAGTFDSLSSNDITVTDIARLDRFPFLLNQTPLYYLSGDVYASASINDSGSMVTGFDLSASIITTAVSAGNPSNGDKLFFKVSTDGDAMRGSFMKVTLTLPTTASPNEQELYCINTHIADSKSHHPLGQ